MISEEMAMKMVDEKMEREAKASAQPEASETTAEQPKPEVKDEPKAEPVEPVGEEPKEPAKAEKPEGKADTAPDQESKDSSDKQPPKKKYSHEERVSHAFALEKQKRKEQHAKDRARIKELEDELKKYKGLTLEDFENNASNFMDWRLKEHDMQAEVNSTKERIEREEAEEMQRETDRRIDLSFETQEERDEYRELIANNAREFIDALKEHDPKGVILDTLNDEPLYPKILRVLMDKEHPEALAYVFRDKTPRKLRRNFEDFIDDYLAGKTPWVQEATSVEVHNQPKVEAKPALPIIGKQVTTSSAPSEPVHDRNYWNNYLRQHPNG